MIINKASYERGFGHGSLYLTVTVDLNDFKRKGEPLTYRFGNLRDSGGPPTPPPGHEPEDEGAADAGRGARLYEKKLGADGFPAIGQTLQQGDPLCAYVDESTGRHNVKRHKSSEAAVVEEVRLLGGDSSAATCEKAKIKLRINRNRCPATSSRRATGRRASCRGCGRRRTCPSPSRGCSPTSSSTRTASRRA